MAQIFNELKSHPAAAPHAGSPARVPSCDGRPNQEEPTMPKTVSIHARLATGDCTPRRPKSSVRSFNSRPSCDGRQAAHRADARDAEVSIHARLTTGDMRRLPQRRSATFQFTPVLRRATTRATTAQPTTSFNSRPSCDGRQLRKNRRSFHQFQFTPVLRRATLGGALQGSLAVSIHARLATGDSLVSICSAS